MATTLHPGSYISSSSSSSMSAIGSQSSTSLGSGTTITQRSPWHSPVPYLFGGLAAMLGLIAFALLILACSYWKLSSQNDHDQQQQQAEDDDDLEKGEGVNKLKTPALYEDKIVVVMAGNHMPTFLAMPMPMPAQIYPNNNNHQHPTTTTTNNNNNQQLHHPSVDDDSTISSSVVVDDEDDDKPKDDENAQHSSSTPTPTTTTTQH